MFFSARSDESPAVAQLRELRAQLHEETAKAMADSEAATKLQAVSRGRSVRKLKQPDWQDTNMALFGRH